MNGVSRAPVVLDIRGMTCTSCVARLERVLECVPGVTSASVSLAAETATVTTTLDDHTPLVAAVERAGYDASVHRGPQARRDGDREHGPRVVVAAVLTWNILILTVFVPHGRFTDLAVWLLATPVQFFCGWPFLRSALVMARARTFTMDTLIALGSLAAYGYSLIALAVGRDPFFDTSAVIITLVLLGRMLEARARARAGDAVRRLLERGSKEATVLIDGRELRVPSEDVREGDLMVVLPGQKVPADGVVREGTSWVDLSMLTGESAPVDVVVGDEVVGASLNGNGRLVVEATRVGEATRLAEIIRQLEAAQVAKAPIQRLADRISAAFVPRVVALAGVTFLFLVVISGSTVEDALLRASALLLVACPCALGLATPVAIMAGSGRAAELGILFKGGDVFEAANAVDVVLLDKTGTMTEGRMRLADVVSLGKETVEQVLALAASAETGSEHPIARAVRDAAAERGVSVPLAGAHQVRPGAGAQAIVGGRLIEVGRPDGLPEAAALISDRLASRGLTVFAVRLDGEAVGLVGVADRVKDGAATAVRHLVSNGYRCALVTGDTRAAAEAVAREIGVEEVVAEVFPEGKLEAVLALRAGGHRVAFVGDGVNDAPALAAADVGIALGPGADVAIEAGDVTVLTGSPAAVATALFLARRTHWIIWQNLAWAFGYNAVMIPMAMTGRLRPTFAAAAMALSSLTVVMNALRLLLYGRGEEIPDSVHEAIATLQGSTTHWASRPAATVL
jgi:Cu+-exporting ATPase